MKQVLVYADSLSWGIIPGSRRRLSFDERWPGVLENQLNRDARRVRVIEDCLNGRRTVWDDPFKAGRNGLAGLAQRIELCSPLSLVILMLGTNDFQSMHPHDAAHSAAGIGALVAAIRQAPIEPGMPVPPVLIVCPPRIQPAKGAVSWKFSGAETKSLGLASALGAVAESLGCPFFDSGTLIASSAVDGVHIDAAEHLTLGTALTEVVARLI